MFGFFWRPALRAVVAEKDIFCVSPAVPDILSSYSLTTVLAMPLK